MSVSNMTCESCDWYTPNQKHPEYGICTLNPPQPIKDTNPNGVSFLEWHQPGVRNDDRCSFHSLNIGAIE